MYFLFDFKSLLIIFVRNFVIKRVAYKTTSTITVVEIEKVRVKTQHGGLNKVFF
jgi:hypothetical protein